MRWPPLPCSKCPPGRDCRSRYPPAQWSCSRCPRDTACTPAMQWPPLGYSRCLLGNVGSFLQRSPLSDRSMFQPRSLNSFQCYSRFLQYKASREPRAQVAPDRHCRDPWAARLLGVAATAAPPRRQRPHSAPGRWHSKRTEGGAKGACRNAFFEKKT